MQGALVGNAGCFWCAAAAAWRALISICKNSWLLLISDPRLTKPFPPYVPSLLLMQYIAAAPAVAGQYYDINLLKEPFKVSEPLEIIDEQTQDGKHMLLFDVQKMTWQDPLDGLV